MSINLDQSEYFELALHPIQDAGYAALPPQLVAAEHTIATKAATKANHLNRQLFRFLLKKFTLDTLPWQLPECVVALYEIELTRMQRICDIQADAYFIFQNDLFRKNLAILLHRLIPFGAEFANPHSGIPRSLAIRAGPKQSVKFLRAVVASRGIRPFLELHMHPEVKEHFHPAGWVESYERLADFLQLNPGWRGVQSTSWFLDPALEQVSPHLGYLRMVPEQCGAYILFAGMDKDGRSGALETSPTRRHLHATRCYRPRLFTRIWPRKEMLRRQWRQLQAPPIGQVMPPRH